ncbi:hypothetical protein Droror1_Dr00018654 [Drosera rotundifolia]
MLLDLKIDPPNNFPGQGFDQPLTKSNPARATQTECQINHGQRSSQLDINYEPTLHFETNPSYKSASTLPIELQHQPSSTVTTYPKHRRFSQSLRSQTPQPNS